MDFAGAKDIISLYKICGREEYGRFLDNIQRTHNDLNVQIFNFYNQSNQNVGVFFIDYEDIKKVKYKKWSINQDNHII